MRTTAPVKMFTLLICILGACILPEVYCDNHGDKGNNLDSEDNIRVMCSLAPDRGSCRDREVRWFYNKTIQRCDQFWYGGCDGNNNNFYNQSDCQKSCMADNRGTDVCKQPSVTGRCRAHHIRWYFNSARQECLLFVYGGCDGNGNRFRTRADCERKCLSGREALGDQERNCRSSRFGCCLDGITTALGNNNKGCPRACQATLYGCCDDEITAAQGPNQEGCEVIEISTGESAPCDQTDYGCCPDGVTAATGSQNEGCDIFSTSGTDTNDTDTDMTVDGGEVPAECQMARNTGPCREYSVMWYFNLKENKCDRFWYGGCEGNSNRFKSEKDCLTRCQRTVSTVKGTGYKLLWFQYGGVENLLLCFRLKI